MNPTPAPASGVRSILGLEFGPDLVPKRPVHFPSGNAGKPVTIYQLGWALKAQLSERAPLVPPKDPIVAGLFLDLANLHFAAGTMEMADAAYGMAERYGVVPSPLLTSRRKEVARILAASKGMSILPGDCPLCESN